MRLNDIDFGPCLDAAGVRGFMGEGYWFHHVMPWYNFNGSTFVAKTSTLGLRTGNMPFQGSEEMFGPRERFPRCIWISWHKGLALNAVGLSGPGLETLIEHGLLNTRSEPYMISIMPVSGTPEERAAEFTQAVRRLAAVLKKRPELRKMLALQINVTCPNTGHRTMQITHEARTYLSLAYELDIPLLVKLNLSAPVESVGEIALHPGCAAICCTNTIAFGTKLPDYLGDQIPWNTLFPNGSPLSQFGGGGLSGKLLLPLVAEWIRAVRKAGITVTLNAGGGILYPRDVDTLVNAGLRREIDSIFIGSIAMLRPWNIQPVIKRAHDLLA